MLGGTGSTTNVHLPPVTTKAGPRSDALANEVPSILDRFLGPAAGGRRLPDDARAHDWIAVVNHSWAVIRDRRRRRKTDADDALFIARLCGMAISPPCNRALEESEQLKLVCRQRRFVTHELANAKRRLTGLIDLDFPEFSGHFESNHSKATHAVLKAAPSAAAIPGFPCAGSRVC